MSQGLAQSQIDALASQHGVRTIRQRRDAVEKETGCASPDRDVAMRDVHA